MSSGDGRKIPNMHNPELFLNWSFVTILLQNEDRNPKSVDSKYVWHHYKTSGNY